MAAGGIADFCDVCGMRFLNLLDSHGLPAPRFCHFWCAVEWEKAQLEFEKQVLGFCRCSLPLGHEGRCVFIYEGIPELED